MRTLLKQLANRVGVGIALMPRTRFAISGMKYEVDPCSVGQTPEGEIAAKGAIAMIKGRRLTDLTILDIFCGIGIIGLTVFAHFKKEGIIRQIVFADINIFNLNSLHKTLRVNSLDHLLGNQIRSYLTDGLANIPTDEKFDIIISNPPHCHGHAFRKEDIPLSASRLTTFDPGWAFHKSFYARCHEYLKERGEVWFLEDGAVAKEDDFLPFIVENRELKYIGMVTEPQDSQFFWMMTQKA